MPKPETSVVITCFNYGHFLDDCIQSVLNQSYRDFEVVVIDDGSTDNTPEIMERYKVLSNVRYFRQENKGQANSKNLGISLSDGKFVAFLDADDRWEERKLEKQVPLFKNKAVGVVYSLFGYMGPKGNPLDEIRTGEYFSPKSGIVTENLFIENFVPFSSTVVRKECFERLGAFDESLKMGIDWDLWLRLSTEFQFDYVNDRLLIYRKGHDGQMSKNLSERQKCADKIMDKFLERFPGKISKRTIKNAYYYTYCNRGYFYATKDPLIAANFYIKAIRTKPRKRHAYLGFLKFAVKYFLRITNK